MTNQRLHDMGLYALAKQICHVEMPEAVTGLLVKAETVQEQRELLGQDVGAVWSACLAEKQMMQLQGVLQLRSDLPDVPPQNTDIGHVDGNNALGIVLCLGDSE